MIGYFKEMLTNLEKLEEPKIEGRMESMEKGDYCQYFHITKDSETGKRNKVYIKVEDRDLARRLAQQSYNERLRKELEQVLSLLERLDRHYRPDLVQDHYESLTPCRQQLIVPVDLSPLEKTLLWKSKPNSRLNMPFLTENIFTILGEQVRSKIEKIIADTLTHYGIAYKYECPTFLANGQRLYPDFTFYDPYLDREIYWEHFGLMDDEDYRRKNLEKIELYELNGIFRGERLIVTYELKNRSLSPEWVRLLINKYLSRLMLLPKETV